MPNQRKRATVADGLAATIMQEEESSSPYVYEGMDCEDAQGMHHPKTKMEVKLSEFD